MVTALEVGKPLAYGKAKVQIYESQRDLGMAAARGAAERIERAIRERGNARVMIATGNSQLDVSAALVDDASIDWKRVDIFHMDEYVGLSAEHPASASYIDGDAEDIGAELARYTKLLQEGPIDVAFVGFGENGHIAFNDPAMADFFDPLMVKCVDLDADCRAQQVHEGHFESVEDVPSQALSVSCSGLLRASSWICCVPEGRKAQAVHRALNGPISIACPASIVRLHRDASVYLDQDSAALLDQPSLQD